MGKSKTRTRIPQTIVLIWPACLCCPCHPNFRPGPIFKDFEVIQIDSSSLCSFLYQQLREGKLLKLDQAPQHPHGNF